MKHCAQTKVRGNDIGMIFQASVVCTLNPLMRIEDQIKESLTYHTKMTARKNKARAIELCQDQWGFPKPRA